MGKSTEIYTKIGTGLNKKNKEVSLSQMFGMPTLKTNGKAFCGLFNEDMVFKLQGEDHAKALAIKGAQPFDPGMGRPMKEWVVVPNKFSDQWKSLAEAAMKYVDAIKQRKPAAKKAAVKKKQ